jgi:hypothetical protein
MHTDVYVQAKFGTRFDIRECRLYIHTRMPVYMPPVYNMTYTNVYVYAQAHVFTYILNPFLTRILTCACTSDENGWIHMQICASKMFHLHECMTYRNIYAYAPAHVFTQQARTRMAHAHA